MQQLEHYRLSDGVGIHDCLIASVCHRLQVPIYSHNLGMSLTRDSLVSVMYSAALNSAKSSVTLQRTDRHEILGQKPTNFQLS